MNAFSRLVCGTEAVRQAFDGTAPLSFWWRIVLWLHGKPTAPTLSEAERTRCIADGFRFYAALYGMLGVALLLVGIALGYIAGQVGYACLGATMGGVFLLTAARFGARSAESFRQGQALSRLHLAAFIVMLIAFLSLLLGVVSAAVHSLGLLTPLSNVALCTALFTLGIGSYFVELVYLIQSPSPCLADT